MSEKITFIISLITIIFCLIVDTNNNFHSKNLDNKSTMKIYKDYTYIITGIQMLYRSFFRKLSDTSYHSGYCFTTNGHAYKYANGGELGFYESFEYTKDDYGIISSVWSEDSKGGNISSTPNISNKAGLFYTNVAMYIYGQHTKNTLEVSKNETSVY